MEYVQSTGVSGKVMTNEDYKKLQLILSKPWIECSAEEKLEKVREELVQLNYMSNRIAELSSQISQLMQHSHLDGKLVAPLHGGLNGLVGTTTPSRRNYLS